MEFLGDVMVSFCNNIGTVGSRDTEYALPLDPHVQTLCIDIAAGLSRLQTQWFLEEMPTVLTTYGTCHQEQKRNDHLNLRLRSSVVPNNLNSRSFHRRPYTGTDTRPLFVRLSPGSVRRASRLVHDSEGEAASRHDCLDCRARFIGLHLR